MTGINAPNLGDLIVVLLAGTLADLRDRLHDDGYEDAADLVTDLVEIADHYVTGCGSRRAPSGRR